MKWLLDQPETMLDQNEVNRQFLHADRTMLHPAIVHENVHGRVIRREMTRAGDNLAAEIEEEVEHALSLHWGTDETDWKEVNVYTTLLDVIARISSRVLVGLPLCRDPAYLRSAGTFNRAVVLSAGTLNLLPGFLRPILSPIILAYDAWHHRRITAAIAPSMAARIANPELRGNDYVQWAIDEFNSFGAPIDPTLIAARLSVLSFAGIQSSSITITNAVYDLASAPNSAEVQSMLRAEVLNNSSTTTNWTRNAVAKLIRIDSVLRESMRLWGFLSRGVMKRVVAPEGVTMPDGRHLPLGAKVGVTSYAVHHDEGVYKDAMRFEPWRFCGEDEASVRSRAGKYNMVTSSDTYMAFSHGKHAW
jgi:cytochrome P450